MKLTLAFLVVALCSSLGNGNPVGREKRQTGTVKQDQAKMFAFMLQGVACAFESVKNGPADKKPAAYKFLVENTIQIVEAAAASFEMKSSDQLLINPADLRSYAQMKAIASSGDYSNIAKVESTISGLLGGVVKALTDVLEGLGLSVDTILGTATRLVGGLPIVGGLLGTVGGVVGGLLD